MCGQCDRAAGVYLFTARSWVVMFVFFNVSFRSRRFSLDRVFLYGACCYERACVRCMSFRSCALVLMFFVFSGLGDRVFTLLSFFSAHVSMSRVCKF